MSRTFFCSYSILTEDKIDSCMKNSCDTFQRSFYKVDIVDDASSLVNILKRKKDAFLLECEKND